MAARGGQAAGVVYTLPVVYLIGVWLVICVASEWCVTAGRSALFGLAVVPVVGGTLPHTRPGSSERRP